MPPGAEWKDVHITFIDKEKVRARVGRTERAFTFTDLGMADARSGEPNAAWLLLRAIAGEFGEMGWDHPEAKDSNRQRMRLLRNHLREFFGLEGDPFHPYKKGAGWKARFTLRPPPPA